MSNFRPGRFKPDKNKVFLDGQERKVAFFSLDEK